MSRAEVKSHEFEFVSHLRRTGCRFGYTKLDHGSMLASQNFTDMELREKFGVGVVAVNRNGWIVSPSPTLQVMPGDEVIYLGGASEIKKFEDEVMTPT